MELSEILSKYAVPDPKIVGKLPKGGIQLDFVGHADITRILLEIDPTWRWVPIAWDNGRPAVHVENGMATMWGELTILGHARLGVGSVPADKKELDKELVGDFLRNAAMRFGISLSLWTKQEWEDLGEVPKKSLGSASNKQVAPRKEEPVAAEENPDELISADFLKTFDEACEKIGLTRLQVCASAGLWHEELFNRDKPLLRATYKVMRGDKP